MKALIAAFAAASLAACATAPPANVVTAIQNACAIDAGLRPIVVELQMVPGLVQPPEALALTAARAVIDPICANPAASPEANTLTALTGASAQIVGVVTAVKARQSAAK